MTSVPKRLAIVGGGVVACEMATAVAGLGADEVTMLVRDDRLLRRMEPFAADQLAAALTARGVDVRLSTTAERVTRPDGQGTPVRLDLSDGGRVEADEVLVATGRRPRSDDIGMESVGLTAGDPLRTEPDLTVAGVSDGWLFAAGDITGTTLLTHQGKYQARLLGDRLAAVHRGHEPDSTPWGAHVPTADTWAVPQVVFSDPEVASVGLTAAQADERGIDTRLLTYDLGQIAGAAVHADGYSGQAAMLIDTAREVVLGVTFVGQDVAELLHAATIAIVGEVPLHRLWHAVPAFPTMSEVWLRLLEEWRGR